jgi:hypothetical protein
MYLCFPAAPRTFDVDPGTRVRTEVAGTHLIGGSTMRKLALLFSTLAAAVAGIGVSAASAHNAGHIFLDGRCLGVGSDKEAPFVGQGAPQNGIGQLDLIYDPVNGVDVSDQYGARWAATRGNTPILPGDCPA